MRITKITGASDDLIEFDGAFSDEVGFPGNEEEGAHIGLSTGDLVRVRYDEDGIWRFKPVVNASGYTIDQVPADESRGYSDIVTVTAPIAWAIVSEGVVR